MVGGGVRWQAEQFSRKTMVAGGVLLQSEQFSEEAWWQLVRGVWWSVAGVIRNAFSRPCHCSCCCPHRTWMILTFLFEGAHNLHIIRQDVICLRVVYLHLIKCDVDHNDFVCPLYGSILSQNVGCNDFARGN